MTIVVALLCVVVLACGVVVVLGFVNGLVALSRWLQHRRSGGAVGDATRELDDGVASSAGALADLGTDVRRSVDDLLALLSRHPEPTRAIRTAQLALRRGGVSGTAPVGSLIDGVSAGSTAIGAVTGTTDAGGDAAVRTGEQQPGMPWPRVHEAASTGQPPLRVRPATADARPSRAAEPSAPTARSIVDRWFDLDNITMLLYLGAGLIVIAAGIFVGSSWDAIGPTARWTVVAATALAFFLVGEGFTRYSAKLARAGETFRGVGMVLLPFVAIAYDAFMLDGAAPVRYWVSVAAILAAVYYALHRWIAPGRMSAYLAGTGVAVTALLLPDAVGLAPEWRAPALLAAAEGLIGVAWAADPSSESSARRLRARAMGALAESHLIVGVLVAVASAIALSGDADVIRPELSTLAYLALLAIGLLLVAAWQRSAWYLGAAAIVVGVLVHQIGHFMFDDQVILAWFLVVVWDALACLAFLVSARSKPSMAPSSLVVDGVSLIYALAAFAYGCAPVVEPARSRPDGLLVVASALLAALFVGHARRRHVPWLLWPAAVVGHVFVLDVLRLVPSRGDLHVVPTSIWLGMAGAWLYASLRKRPDWTAPAWSALFVSEAVWAALYAVIDETYVSAVMAGVALTVAWGVWMLAHRVPGGAFVVAVQAAYALVAVWLLGDLPAVALPAVSVAVCVAALAVGGRLPDGVRSMWDRSAGAALVAAPFAGYVVAGMGVPDSAIGVLDLPFSGQSALLVSLLILGALGRDRGRRAPVAVAMVQAYLLYGWILAEGDVTAVQTYSAPLALMLLGLAWLLADAREPLEGVAAAILLLPATAQAAVHDTLGYTVLLGMWGVALLAAGISFERRTLLVGGIVGLLLAALRQLWEIIALLPPGFVVGAAGLVLMAVAVSLMWRRDTVLDLGRRGGRYWDRIGGRGSR